MAEGWAFAAFVTVVLGALAAVTLGMFVIAVVLVRRNRTGRK